MNSEQEKWQWAACVICNKTFQKHEAEDHRFIVRLDEDTVRLRALEARVATAEAKAARQEHALGLWMALFKAGYRKRGVGAGSVLMPKYGADEARFWTEQALSQSAGQS